MPKILLVEDDEQLARFLMRFLNSEGYTTDYANGQKDGIRKALEDKGVEMEYAE